MSGSILKPDSKLLYNPYKPKPSRFFKLSNCAAPYKSFYNRQKIIRRCAYIIKAIKIWAFVKHGAIPVKISEDFTAYIKLKNYGETGGVETSAIIGIPKTHLLDLMNDQSELYNVLRKHPLTSDIAGIYKLAPYRLNVLDTLSKSLDSLAEDEVVIFNIEPKGSDLYAKHYPSANICLPGGGMEEIDNNDFESCARREFSEETGFNLDPNTPYLTKLKVMSGDRICYYYIFIGTL